MPRKNIPERKKTAVQLDKEIRDKLNLIKIIPEEKLESVIKRLIGFYEENKG
ncbi:hypothetical protein LCGC14_1016630 [marine sediment metagenome]|uniref:Uncharacterized protein n=1 Tax=marine sediment metagenome TaxID=412755 RepID=A0A0F9R4P7_9ZZZZ